MQPQCLCCHVYLGAPCTKCQANFLGLPRRWRGGCPTLTHRGSKESTCLSKSKWKCLRIAKLPVVTPVLPKHFQWDIVVSNPWMPKHIRRQFVFDRLRCCHEMLSSANIETPTSWSGLPAIALNCTSLYLKSNYHEFGTWIWNMNFNVRSELKSLFLQSQDSNQGKHPHSGNRHPVASHSHHRCMAGSWWLELWAVGEASLLCSHRDPMHGHHFKWMEHSGLVLSRFVLIATYGIK